MKDEQYFNRILDSYMQMLLRIAYSYVKNTQDSEDIVSEVLVRLIKKEPHFESEEHERAWLIRVTINVSLDYLKASKRREVALLENQNGAIEERSEVLEEILNLPGKYKKPIYLHYVEGYSIKEIALILKKPEATIGTWLARGRKLLKHQLEEGQVDGHE